MLNVSDPRTQRLYDQTADTVTHAFIRTTFMDGSRYSRHLIYLHLVVN